MDLELRGRRAFVTGASSGIGAATARILAEEGADVAIGYGRNEAGAEATTQAVRAAGREALAVSFDQADPDSVTKGVARVGQAFDALDVAVLSAGRNVVMPLEELTPAAWDEIVRINLNGTFYLLQALRPLLREGASVVLLASVAAHTGAPHHAHYAAAKAGVVSLAKSAARALAPHVRVNALAPGITVTPMGADAIAALDDDYAQRKLLAQRFATPDEIARCIAFLASPLSSFIVGATIDINGGRTLR